MAYLYSRLENRNIAVLAVLLMVLFAGSIIGSQIERNRHQMIDRNLGAAYHIDNEQAWLGKYSRPGKMIRAPEYTKNLLVYSSMLDGNPPSYREAVEKYEIMTPNHAVALTAFEDPNESQYFVLSTRVGEMSLQNWIIISSWSNYRNEIHDNPYTNKIYTEGPVWVFSG